MGLKGNEDSFPYGGPMADRTELGGFLSQFLINWVGKLTGVNSGHVSLASDDS